MRKSVLLLAVLGVSSASLVWAASEFDMDLMQTVEDTSKDLVSNLSMGDAAAANTDLSELDSLLAQVEDHYVQKGNADDAVVIVKDGRTLLVDIANLVAANDFDAANAKSTEFSRTCKACHKIYKKS